MTERIDPKRCDRFHFQYRCLLVAGHAGRHQVLTDAGDSYEWPVPIRQLDASEAGQLADYIVEWLRNRNGAQLEPAIGAMSVHDFENLHGELAHILMHGGHPPNWVPRKSRSTPDRT